MRFKLDEIGATFVPHSGAGHPFAMVLNATGPTRRIMGKAVWIEKCR
jgi:hypothetical protein